MKHETIISDGEYRLVRYEPAGEARIEHEGDEAHSDWLTADDVEKIRANPGLMRSVPLLGAVPYESD